MPNRHKAFEALEYCRSHGLLLPHKDDCPVCDGGRKIPEAYPRGIPNFIGAPCCYMCGGSQLKDCGLTVFIGWPLPEAHNID